LNIARVRNIILYIKCHRDIFAGVRARKGTRLDCRMEDGGRDAKGRFITGNSGGGRSRGARSRLGERFSEDVLSAWEMHGPEAIQIVARERPHEFLRIVASIMPKEFAEDVALRVAPAATLSDDELAAIAAGDF